VSDQTSPEGEHPPSSEDLRLAYEQVHNRYAGITDFRAKLLGLLPLVTGTSAFLLLAQVKDPDSNLRKFLGPMGILGLVVTLGLFIYELRGMQRCQELEKQGRELREGDESWGARALSRTPAGTWEHARCTGGRADHLHRYRRYMALLSSLRVQVVHKSVVGLPGLHRPIGTVLDLPSAMAKADIYQAFVIRSPVMLSPA
jgi:hypothetical protein